MKNPISIFILDVSNSSAGDIGEELSQYLDEMVTWITSWTKDTLNIKVKHRAGDEIIFAGDGYATAYTIAFFISRVWKYKKNHLPYFGLSFGDSERPVKEIDIEKWIHPLLKQARYANDLLKQEKSRPLFKFELDQFLADGHELPFRYEFELLINGLLNVQQDYIRKQTEIQKMVFSLYFILEQQKSLSQLLSKTPPTISSHLKKGNSSEIMNTFYTIQTVLDSLQSKQYPEIKLQTEELAYSIRKHLKSNLNELLEGGV